MCVCYKYTYIASESNNSKIQSYISRDAPGTECGINVILYKLIIFFISCVHYISLCILARKSKNAFSERPQTRHREC